MSHFAERVDEPQDAQQIELETETYPQPRNPDNADSEAIRRKTETCKYLFESCQTLCHDDEIDSLYARFHWWSLGIGALKQGHASLDHRVRTRHDIREKIVRLLDKLAISLRVCHTIESNRSQQKTATHVSHIESGYNHSDLEENLAYILSNIKYLSRISAAIRKHGTKFRHEHVDKLLSEESVDIKEFSDYLKVLILLKPTQLGLRDVLQAYSETPPSLDSVQKRLIQANLVRRNRFNHYYKTYLRKDGQSLMARDDNEQEIVRQSQDYQSSSSSKPALVLRKEQNPPKITLEDRSLTSSQTATDIGSAIMPEQTHSRQATSTGSRVSRSVLKQDYPRCPVADGDFWCPFCAEPLDSSYSNSKRDIKWRGHVLEDLSPYICVYPDCDQPDAMYVTVDEWRKHLKSRHAISRWICDVCYLESSSPDDFVFDEEEQWRSHTLSCHSEEISIQDLDDIAEESRRKAVPPVACPLCDDSTVLFQPDTDKHITSHLHSFALQALPWETIGPDNDTRAPQASRGSYIGESSHSESEDETEDTDWSASYSMKDLEPLLNECISRCEQLSQSKDFELLHDTCRKFLETLHDLQQSRSSLNVEDADEAANLMIRLSATLSRIDNNEFVATDLPISETLDADLRELLAPIKTIVSKIVQQEKVLIQPFGGEECTSTSSVQCQMADMWKEKFRLLMNKHSGSQVDHLKVAILDSGIADHIDFVDEERILERKSWIEDSTYIDESGHGTHIVGTVLEMTKNVDVYVGRIFKSRYVSETNHIAKAIKYAREIQKVDIISLSFGFPSRIKSIQDEIKKCIHEDILVFAAASGDTNNASRAFPARQDGVFCVYAATGTGNSAVYNPRLEEHGDNFTFVGDSIQSSWLNHERRYMSGTSFATPVAISVVAFIYGFICQEIPRHLDLPISAKSPEGMRKILRLMKHGRDGYDLIDPLWYFKQFTKEKMVADITNVLST